MSVSNSPTNYDELLLVVSSSAALAVAGLDVRLIDTVAGPLPSPAGEGATENGGPVAN